jgi:hypothetical protein
MKIFGINFTTKKELEQVVSVLRYDLDECEAELEERTEELVELRKAFPLDIDQVVYDVALKNDKGRYTKTRPSLEYSTITAVTVTEKNYFSLVNRYKNNDVFTSEAAAKTYLNSICK